MINMKPDKTKIDDRSVTKRKCDHPGVVGENESCISTKSNEKTSKIIFIVWKIIELWCKKNSIEDISSTIDDLKQLISLWKKKKRKLLLKQSFVHCRQLSDA